MQASLREEQRTAGANRRDGDGAAALLVAAVGDDLRPQRSPASASGGDEQERISTDSIGVRSFSRSKAKGRDGGNWKGLRFSSFFHDGDGDERDDIMGSGALVPVLLLFFFPPKSGLNLISHQC